MRKANLFLILVLLFLYVPLSIQAQVPSLISYQGTLADDNGEPVSDGTYTMSFKLYDSETGTTTVWGEEQSVMVVNGIFNVLLGREEEFNIEFDEQYWLGISVEGGSEMSPRIQLASSPYSMKAKSVEDRAITNESIRSGEVIKTLNNLTDDVTLEAGENITIVNSENIITISAENETGGLELPWSSTIDKSGEIAFSVRNESDIAIRGVSNGRYGDAIRGESNHELGTGVLGVNRVTNVRGLLGSETEGVVGTTGDNEEGWAIWGIQGDGEFAGKFSGDVDITGELSKSSGSFKIDHPLEPENKWLNHSFVESPDMMNVYNGNITLDTHGEAWVDLPEYFEKLNKDFRYQLTPIGAPGPDLYIAQEVKDNQFQISGGSSGMKVSWQVTGVRNDPYAQKNPIQVEVEKSEDNRGKYLHPEAYGLPQSMSINASRLSKMKE